MKKASILLGVTAFLISQLAIGQIYNLAELSTTQFDALNRDTTVILIPTGVLEQHGPHLPLYTDGYGAEWLTKKLAEEIVALRNRQVVIFPSFPIGVGEPEEFAPRKRFPGSYAVRSTTQRALLMDIATGLGEDGFKWIFVMAFHGPLLQSRSIEQACEYFNDVYGGTMVSFNSAIHPNPPETTSPLSEQEMAATGVDHHAGIYETSSMLFMKPDLVSSGYKDLEILKAEKLEDYHSIAQKPNWPGYFGAPNLSRADIGAKLMQNNSKNLNDLAIKILDGLDVTQLESSSDRTNPGLLKLDEEIVKLEKIYTEKQNRWLASKGYE